MSLYLVICLKDFWCFEKLFVNGNGKNVCVEKWISNMWWCLMVMFGYVNKGEICSSLSVMNFLVEYYFLFKS